ncbi:UNVERIFIED_CONTAM: anti-sigma B factor antagonist/stage II sporulation protein AA (anti-sigma F factor antagonist) [Acetivibrio alkalicellulosi]
MDIKKYLKDNVMVFELSGKLDVNTSPAVQDEIMVQIEPDCRIIIDMEKCDYVSSAGLRVLMIIAKQMAKVGGFGALVGLQEEIKDVMEMTGFDNLFIIHENIEQALVSVHKEEAI